jgi:hypothetical protein
MVARQTNRIKYLSQQSLSPDELRLVSDIEKYGCHIIHVREENGILGWSYTIGLYDVLQQPELIVVGLNDQVAQSLLNEAAHRLEDGKHLIHERQVELLANVQCEFKLVDRKWLRQLMGYAVWFYGGDNFPVLQCVYPDLDNRFPWECGFDPTWRTRQALVFENAPETVTEKDLWAANDPNSSLYDWKFPDPPHTMVFTTKIISNGHEPVLYVYHDADDGAWQFHGQSDSNIESAVAICFHHVVDRDPTLKEISNLPIGWMARRNTPSDPWVCEVITEENS